MKVFKKTMAILLAAMLLIALCVPAFAATQHSYVAYQIFSGTQAVDDTEGKLANVAWGAGIYPTGLLNALKAKDEFAACVSAQDVARIVSTYPEDGDAARAFAKLAYQQRVGSGIALNGNTVLDAGYYLVVDVTRFAAGETNTVYNLALLQLTKKGEFEIKEKATVPTVDKKVYEETNTNWQDAADYDFLDEVPFRLVATIGDIRDYDTYQIIFHDTLSNGLTYKADSAKVVLKSGATTKDLTAQDYSIAVGSDSRTLDLTINDLRALGVANGDTIIVEYNAILNDKAVVGSAGNPNDVYLEYSNNPNDETKTGITPTEEVMVYTWGIDLNKVTERYGQIVPLQGAEFELFRDCGTTAPNCFVSLGKEEVTPVTDEKGNILSCSLDFEGLDAGTYKLEETKTPSGYNRLAEPIVFTITTSFDGEKIATFEVNGEGFVADITEGRATVDVINMAGVTLPETGGIGTTVFYVIGALLLTCSVVVLVTKKRVGAEN